MQTREQRIAAVHEEALAEALATTTKWPEFHSVHEGYAVILEELDELWDECRQRDPNKDKLRREAVQVAAMAIRFAAEIA